MVITCASTYNPSGMLHCCKLPAGHDGLHFCNCLVGWAQAPACAACGHEHTGRCPHCGHAEPNVVTGRREVYADHHGDDSQIDVNTAGPLGVLFTVTEGFNSIVLVSLDQPDVARLHAQLGEWLGVTP